jgi:predicted Fe-Mo cluster-binding NifX family protein
MIIALPLTENDAFSPHFGAAAKAALFEVDPAARTVLRTATVVPPDPEPCGWADWLGAQGVTRFLAGGMGRGAQQRMAAAGIVVTVGVAPAAPQELVQAFLAGSLAAGANACEGGHHGHGGHGHHEHPHHGGHDHEHGHSCGCGSH